MSKISELSNGGALLPTDDLIVVRSGGNVRAQLSAISGQSVSATTLAASGATTLSSTLAVTGALTVDTDTLVVDATNNRVGIGTSSPSTALEVSGAVTVTRSDVSNDNSTISNEGGLFTISAATGGGGGTYPMLFKTAAVERSCA